MAQYVFFPGRGAVRRRAFTLVELLVVIGIIALLISILLPSLSAARKQAATLKCAAALREIGNAALMYEAEYKQFFPPAKLITNDFNNPYNIDGIDYPSAQSGNNSPYWQTFMAKYVTKSKTMGAIQAGTTDMELARRSIFWGCPAWDGYYGTAVGTNALQPGLGWNAWPTYELSHPQQFQELSQISTAAGEVFVPTWPLSANGTWHKAGRFTHPTQKALCGDSLFWIIESESPLGTMGPNGVIPGQPVTLGTTTYTAAGQTLLDFYRHGTYPANNGVVFNTSGGKIAFNILYADGHVSTLHDRKEGYLALRQRFPG